MGAIVLLLPLLFAGGFVFGAECKTTGLLLLQVDPIRRFTGYDGWMMLLFGGEFRCELF